MVLKLLTLVGVGWNGSLFMLGIEWKCSIDEKMR